MAIVVILKRLNFNEEFACIFIASFDRLQRTFFGNFSSFHNT